MVSGVEDVVFRTLCRDICPDGGRKGLCGGGYAAGDGDEVVIVCY